jgi:hypothetical protein
MNLGIALSDFCDRSNNNIKAKQLVTSWDRLIEIQVDGFGKSFFIETCNSVANLTDNSDGRHANIVIEGSQDVITGIFSGSKNPSVEVLDGNLALFGSDMDQIKLDALSLILWGV